MGGRYKRPGEAKPSLVEPQLSCCWMPGPWWLCPCSASSPPSCAPSPMPPPPTTAWLSPSLCLSSTLLPSEICHSLHPSSPPSSVEERRDVESGGWGLSGEGAKWGRGKDLGQSGGGAWGGARVGPWAKEVGQGASLLHGKLHPPPMEVFLVRPDAIPHLHQRSGKKPKILCCSHLWKTQRLVEQ